MDAKFMQELISDHLVGFALSQDSDFDACWLFQVSHSYWAATIFSHYKMEPNFQDTEAWYFIDVDLCDARKKINLERSYSNCRVLKIVITLIYST